jgi:ribosome-associated heat shock protein Hsp15
MDKVRIDKWLWSVRIFKSRSMATDACKANHVKVDDQPAKASASIHRGDIIQVRKAGFNLVYKVIDLVEKRVSAPLAQVCYEDQTPPDELNKYKEWFVGKAKSELRERGSGRPTKKDRRLIEAHKHKKD